MYKLFIDTHNNLIIYALYLNDKLVLNKEIVSGRRHGDTAIPSLKDFLIEAKIKITDIKEVFVVTGPGSFTGVRIGVTIAKMLAYTLNIPIKTIDSLTLYALAYDGDFLINIPDEKGYYCANFKDGSIVNLPFYLKKDEYDKYIKNNKSNVNKCGVINYEKLITYMNNKECENVHSVKPIYIKVIEALK